MEEKRKIHEYVKDTVFTSETKKRVMACRI